MRLYQIGQQIILLDNPAVLTAGLFILHPE